MNEKSRLGSAAWDNHEVLFAICMGIVALLARENPLLEFPAAGWAFGSFLGFNLGYHRLLRRGALHWPLAFLSVAVNTLLVTWILSVSGGADSSFWPMYLLPIFTAALYLRGAHVLVALTAPAGFLTLLYSDALWQAPGWRSWDLLIKLAVLAFAGATLTGTAASERRSKADLDRARQDLDGLARSNAQDARAAGDSAARVRKAIHDSNNMVTVVLASADLALSQAAEQGLREDLSRIKEAARRCGLINEEIAELARRAGSDAPLGAELLA